MTKSKSLTQAAVKSPFLWGGAASVGFYSLIFFGAIDGPFIQRYFTAHPVEHVTTTMFFVGLAALVLKLMEILGQRRTLHVRPLGPNSQSGLPVAECKPLLEQLDRMPSACRDDYRIRRLRASLEHVRRHSSSESLGDELKYLADVDMARSQAGYGLVRLIVWAIPILGFLGTVIGITLAIAHLTPPLEDSLPEVIGKLSIAFNTTALALSLSIALMLVQFLVERSENELLDQVDSLVYDDLIGRFEMVGDRPDGQLVVVRRMIEAVVASSEDMVRRQAELWERTMEGAGERWAHMANEGGKQLQGALAGALAENLKLHAQELAATEQNSVERNRRHWEGVQAALTQNVQALTELQREVTRQADVLGRTVDAAGQVARLEAELNRNLSTLAGSRNFEGMVDSLAAAIHLLNSNLRKPVSPVGIQLDPKNPLEGRAA